MSKVEMVYPMSLAVPYAEKDSAKKLGAKWNPEARVWYAPDAQVAFACKKWWPAGLKVKGPAQMPKKPPKQQHRPAKNPDGSWPKNVGSEFEEYDCVCGLPPWDCECYIEYKLRVNQTQH